MSKYFENLCAGIIRNPVDGKVHRISVRDGIPYITYQRKTRILFKGPLGLGAVINVKGDKVFLRDAVNPSLHVND